MPPVSKMGDMILHAGFTPSTIVSGSPNVLVNNVPVATVGSTITPHALIAWPNTPCPPTPIAFGSTTVLVNGKPIARMGDKAGCGAIILQLLFS